MELNVSVNSKMNTFNELEDPDGLAELVIPDEMEDPELEELDNSINKEYVGKKKSNKQKIFDHSKKMELVKKINKIKKKEYLLNIFKIIKLHSNGYDVNNNGVFVFFHNLPDEVYEQIELYVNNIYKMHKKTPNFLNLYGSELSDTQIISSDIIEITTNKELSNKEKLIMKRKKYEKYLDQNQEK